VWHGLYTLHISDEVNKELGYCRETALQGALVLARSGRLGPGDDILQTL